MCVNWNGNKSSYFKSKKGLRLGMNGPLVSHLMFSDDLLLFGKATKSQIDNMMEVLDVFCAASSQLISKEKTGIMFSSNTPMGIHRKIIASSGFREVEDLGLYLGVPLSGKSHRINTYQFLIDKVCAKLSHWKCNQFSFVVRVTLVKFVIEALPTYSMMSSKVPKDCL
ncbi:unnamed protein product [Lathyrus oleraceus]